ncbi:MAG: phage N-6-adenine-methyltransferase [Bacteroidales bacterium]|nr:phage N-6-adenine-methyltransferase [Bacteroidales bacterium]
MASYVAPAKRSDWETPCELFQALDAEFHFDIDVCASEQNHKCEAYYTEEQDGLTQEWRGNCWCNPPYGRQLFQWVRHASLMASTGKATTVMLLPVRTDTKWFHDYINGKTEVRFVRGRVKFAGAKDRAPFPTMIVIFRRTADGN